jgi:FkbM family methyltransferase
MKEVIKKYIREILVGLRIGITRNLQYDIQTRDCLKKILRPDSCCIDVGAHEGEILDLILKFAPQGKHFAFEPIPVLFKQLKEKYAEKVEVLPYALSAENGKATFQYVRNAPAYSGLKRRSYKVKPDIEEIPVDIKRLDDLIQADRKIDLIKIDVEGAEYGVLKGGEQLIKKHKPYIIFEFGLGASEHYNTTPDMIFDFMSTCGLSIYRLHDFLASKTSLSKTAFEEVYRKREDYYFVAGLSK